MPLNFPASPSLNDTYSFGGKTWIWAGQYWRLQSAGSVNDIPIGNVTPSTGNFTTVGISGNITANAVLTDNYFYANGDPFVSSNYDDTDVAAYLPTYTGNITAGTGTFTTLEVQTGVGSNLIPTSNEVYDLGSADNRWRDLFLSGNTIDLGGARIKSDATEGTIALIPSTPAGNTKAIIIGQRGISTVETDEFGDVSAEAISEAANAANTITGNLTATEIKAESYFFANGDPMLSSAAVRVGRRSGGPMSVRMASGATIAVIGRNGTTLVSIDV
jgi:hypothetical protein